MSNSGILIFLGSSLHIGIFIIYLKKKIDVVLSATGVSEAADKVENVSKTETPVKKIESPSPVAVASAVPVEAKKLAGALAILDPANFTLEGAQPQKLRVTKESFTNKNATQLGTSKDPADPLSQLDPLWSLTK